jgi:hypothetical protein
VYSGIIVPCKKIKSPKKSEENMRSLKILYILSFLLFATKIFGQSMQIDVVPKALEQREGVISALGELQSRNYLFWKKIKITRYPSPGVDRKEWIIRLSKRRVDSIGVLHVPEMLTVLIMPFGEYGDKLIYTIQPAEEDKFFLGIAIGDSSGGISLLNAFGMTLPRKHGHIEMLLRFAKKVDQKKIKTNHQIKN